MQATTGDVGDEFCPLKRQLVNEVERADVSSPARGTASNMCESQG